jgi:predicted Zn-dependent peptidase
MAAGTALGLVLAAAPPVAIPLAAQAAATRMDPIAVQYQRLSNGLRVVLSPDHTAPTVTVAVYYNVGLRLEPRNRTGFAHLFEHMMFQGSRNLGKMEFIRLVQRSGGTLNGSTRFDFTNYFETLPAHRLETALWAEADRMRGLDITQENLTNQQGVVKNEVRVNVLNQPYGGFPWLDLPQYANENWYNAHNFYGDLNDLDSARLEDVQAFFRTYYAPNNAVLVVVGDFEPREAEAWVRRYFGDIPSGPAITPPDIREPRQTAEKRATREDRLAPRPALAIGWKMPDRNTPEYWAMGILDQILLQGRDSRLHLSLVQRAGVTSGVGGGINLLGNMFNYNGPMLYTVSMIHDANRSADSILAMIDTEVRALQDAPVDAATLQRARVKFRSQLYNTLGSQFGRADLLASFALFDDDPARINRLEDELARVTPELLQRTAREVLRSTNRTILTVTPGAAAPGSEE